MRADAASAIRCVGQGLTTHGRSLESSDMLLRLFGSDEKKKKNVSFKAPASAAEYVRNPMD